MEQFTILPLYVIPATVGIMLALTCLSSALIPNYWQILNESLYRTVLSMLISNVGTASLYFFPLFFAIFHLVLFSNFIGLIPYSITASTELVVTLFLAITLLFGILIHGVFLHGWRLVHLFLPAGTPIGLLFLMIPLEILAYLTRTLSLGLRLAANLITGHILVKVVLSFIPNVFPSVLLLSFLILFLVVFLA